MFRRGARRGLRWTQRTSSPGPALFLEQLRGCEPTLALSSERRIQADLACGTESREAPFRERKQRGRHFAVGCAVSWRRELRDHFTAVCHQDALARAHLSNVLAQTIFQFADTDGLHVVNVASCSHIVNVAGVGLSLEARRPSRNGSSSTR